MEHEQKVAEYLKESMDGHLIEVYERMDDILSCEHKFDVEKDITEIATYVKQLAWILREVNRRVPA